MRFSWGSFLVFFLLRGVGVGVLAAVVVVVVVVVVAGVCGAKVRFHRQAAR